MQCKAWTDEQCRTELGSSDVGFIAVFIHKDTCPTEIHDTKRSNKECILRKYLWESINANKTAFSKEAVDHGTVWEGELCCPS